MISAKQLIEMIARMGEKIQENEDYLTELDTPIADGDHGINMARGFRAVAAKPPDLSGKDAGFILKSVGMTLTSTVGGAAGPLYGTSGMIVLSVWRRII